MSAFNWIGLVVGVAGIVFALRRWRLGAALVFASLVLVSIWNGNMTGWRWILFWIGFTVTVVPTFFVLYERRITDGVRVFTVRRRHLGIGILQLLWAFVLATGWEINHPFDGWGGWLTVVLILLVVGLVVWLFFKSVKAIAVLAVLAALLLISIPALNGLIGEGGDEGAAPTPTATATATGTSAPTGTGTATGEACPADFEQHFDANKAHRFYSSGVKTSDLDLVYLGHDARTLTFRAFAMHLVDTPDPSKYLEPGSKCLSREGQDLYNQVKGALLASGVKPDNNGVAPANGVNSGMDNGRAVIDTEPGVYGDRSAIVYTLRDGTKIYVLHRCGNVIFGTPPKNVPKGKTDNPKPPKSTSTPSPSKTTLSPKKLSDHPAKQGNAPAVTWEPAPAPTAAASSPGGYSTPKSTSTSTPTATRTTSSPPPSPTVTATYVCTDPNDPTCG